MAFVSLSPLAPGASSMNGTRVNTRATVRSARGTRVTPRASLQEENKKARDAAQYRGPQGFTTYAEKVNGRMAMLGFTIGLMTEIINPNHPAILKQVASALDFVPFVHALTL